MKVSAFANDSKSPCKIVSLQLARMLLGAENKFVAPGIQLPKPASASVFLSQKGYFTVVSSKKLRELSAFILNINLWKDQFYQVMQFFFLIAKCW